MNNNLNRIQISFVDVSLDAPETPDYLNIAAQIIRMRQAQFGVEFNSDFTADSVQESNISPSIKYSEETLLAKTESVAVSEINSPVETVSSNLNLISKPSPVKRGRWFHSQFPLITIEDGSRLTLKSLEELRNILIQNGLQPHPRGDASMLLWQVRNRLGFHVEAVSDSD